MNISISYKKINIITEYLEKNAVFLIVLVLLSTSIVAWLGFYDNGLGLAYNDARSHLNIGRRVVEGLKPGIAQIGSVWLPLPHVLMIPTIWTDFMWHSGLAGAIQSMASFVITGVLVYLFLKELSIPFYYRIFGVFLFAANLNVLYLQSTAMTELLLLATMTAGAFYLLLWTKDDRLIHLIGSSFFIMLATLIRYDGWFLLFFATLIVVFETYRKKGFKAIEGTAVLYMSMGGLGIFLWLVWNLLIFKDPLYFAFGPFSAHSQQTQLEAAGDLPTKGNLILSTKMYLYALFYNSYTIPAILGFFGVIAVWFSKRINLSIKVTLMTLVAPLLFNVIALYLGHSVLFIQGISGTSWFNVRYGIMLAPSIAIFVTFLLYEMKNLKAVVAGLIFIIIFFGFGNYDAVTIDDARVGSSQKNVTEVSGWLRENAADKEGFVLISAASHDAIIFSSGMPMKKFIHEGTGLYWESAIALPDRWARWIIMRTHDDNDLTFKGVKESGAIDKYNLVGKFPFADIYELKPEYIGQLNTTPSLGKQK